MATDLGCKTDVIHRMYGEHKAWGALKSVLSNIGLGINAKKSLKVKSLLRQGASKLRIYYDGMWGQSSTTCSNPLKQPNGELPVAVKQSQLRTMASKTVDPIDWPLPPHTLHRAVPSAPRIARYK